MARCCFPAGAVSLPAQVNLAWMTDRVLSTRAQTLLTVADKAYSDYLLKRLLLAVWNTK